MHELKKTDHFIENNLEKTPIIRDFDFQYIYLFF